MTFVCQYRRRKIKQINTQIRAVCIWAKLVECSVCRSQAEQRLGMRTHYSCKTPASDCRSPMHIDPHPAKLQVRKLHTALCVLFLPLFFTLPCLFLLGFLVHSVLLFLSMSIFCSTLLFTALLASRSWRTWLYSHLMMSPFGSYVLLFFQTLSTSGVIIQVLIVFFFYMGWINTDINREHFHCSIKVFGIMHFFIIIIIKVSTNGLMWNVPFWTKASECL